MTMLCATIQPSRYQRHIFDFVRSGSDHGVVRATAGLGKTTTLVEIAKMLPPDLKACFLAFNSHVASELDERLPRGVKARTVHSLGREALVAAHPHLKTAKVEGKKYQQLVQDAIKNKLRVTFGMLSDRDFQTCTRYLTDLVLFTLCTLEDATQPENLQMLAVRYNLTPPDDAYLEAACYEEVPHILEFGATTAIEAGLYSFDDMVYLPVKYDLPVPQFDFVFIDEAQDLNRTQLELTLRAMREGGRQLFVGDPRQAIYGFSGADTVALDHIIARTDCPAVVGHLPLPEAPCAARATTRAGDRSGTRRYRG